MLNAPTSSSPPPKFIAMIPRIFESNSVERSVLTALSILFQISGDKFGNMKISLVILTISLLLFSNGRENAAGKYM